MFDSIFNLCDVSKTGGEKIWKIMPLIIARQMYRFGNWLRISVILKMLYNQLVDIWTTHSRHLNREIIDIVAQRRKLIGSWQSLKSENIRVGRDPGGQWIQQEFLLRVLAYFHASPTPGLLPHLSYLSSEPTGPWVQWIFRWMMLHKWRGKGCVKMEEADKDTQCRYLFLVCLYETYAISIYMWEAPWLSMIQGMEWIHD